MIKARIGSFCLLPFDKFTIGTKLRISEAREALSNETKPTTKGDLGFKNFDYSKKFYGEVNERNFTIRRTIEYRNSFLPTIKGTIKQSSFSIQETDINIEMRMGIFVMVFGAIWFGILILTSLSILIQILENSNRDSDTIIPIIMLIFGYVLFTGSFSYEAAKARKLLIAIFEGEEV